ncbi:PQ-loop repeat-containing protein [Candidatus Babeliales bacterium]|nr:PQ-loop repeat-containing protein [Candidatus Babeliales bacterium]
MDPFIISILAWISLLSFAVSFLPQIVKNYRLKTTIGLSNVYLLSYLTAYITCIYYVFHCDLLAAYKVFVPLELLGLFIIIGQRFAYEGFAQHKRFFAIVGALSFVGLASFPLGMWWPLEFGMTCGWISSIFFLTYQIPQVLKIFRQKSVHGFSFLFVSIIGLGTILELVVSFAKPLPVPTQFMAIRGLAFYIIFCLQFYLYRTRV